MPPGDPLSTGTATGAGLPAANNSNTSTPTTQFYGAQQQQQQQGAGAQTGAASALNQYTQGQQQLQGTLPQTLQSVLSGQSQVPDYFTAPPQVFKAYNDNFQQSVAPGIAAQFGAGSPQMASQQSIGNQNLAANLYQNGQGNYLNYLNSAANVAFNPVGQQTANSAANNWQSQNNGNTQGYQTGSPLGALGLGGAAAGSVLSQLAALLGLTGGP